MNPVLIFREHGNTPHPDSLRRHSLWQASIKDRHLALFHARTSLHRDYAADSVRIFDRIAVSVHNALDCVIASQASKNLLPRSKDRNRDADCVSLGTPAHRNAGMPVYPLRSPLSRSRRQGFSHCANNNVYISWKIRLSLPTYSVWVSFVLAPCR
jgi:hypothetical protein